MYMWSRLPGIRWIVIPRPPGGDLPNALLMTSSKARWQEGSDGQFRLVSTEESFNRPNHIPRPKLRVTPTVAWERKMNGRWKFVAYPGEDQIHVGWQPVHNGGWKSVYLTKEEMKMIVVPRRHSRAAMSSEAYRTSSVDTRSYPSIRDRIFSFI
ncbi:Hypp1804 [Branchiostoma lanceolatum]|uniref:Hypp1804 protein n=1 Tax=Branchiostoma lanceolatum TaxID=7740 RepID=A0A8J9ZPI0_BRALA|nr:Hypp1804 [Branchiostoma lanceolatum]